MSVQPPAGSDLQSLHAWARRIVDDINRFLPTIGELPVHQDDQAAEAARVKVGEGYVTPTGELRRRMA